MHWSLWKVEHPSTDSLHPQPGWEMNEIFDKPMEAMIYANWVYEETSILMSVIRISNIPNSIGCRSSTIDWMTVNNASGE